VSWRAGWPRLPSRQPSSSELLLKLAHLVRDSPHKRCCKLCFMHVWCASLFVEEWVCMPKSIWFCPATPTPRCAFALCMHAPCGCDRRSLDSFVVLMTLSSQPLVMPSLLPPLLCQPHSLTTLPQASLSFIQNKLALPSFTPSSEVVLLLKSSSVPPLYRGRACVLTICSRGACMMHVSVTCARMGTCVVDGHGGGPCQFASPFLTSPLSLVECSLARRHHFFVKARDPHQ